MTTKLQAIAVLVQKTRSIIANTCNAEEMEEFDKYTADHQELLGEIARLALLIKPVLMYNDPDMVLSELSEYTDVRVLKYLSSEQKTQLLKIARLAVRIATQ